MSSAPDTGSPPLADAPRQDAPRLPLTPHDWPHAWMGPFLEALARLGNKAQACQVVGISYDSIKLRRRNDPVFNEAVIEADLVWRDYLRGLGHRAATTGRTRRRTVTRREMNGRGEVVKQTETTVEETVADNGLLHKYLQAYAPEFRNTGDAPAPTGPLEVVIYRDRSPERALELARLVLEDAERRAKEGRELPTIEGRALPPADAEEELGDPDGPVLDVILETEGEAP